MPDDSRTLIQRLRKKARRGYHGYPIGTVAFLGPDDKRANKLTLAIFLDGEADADEIRNWCSESADIREDANVLAEALAYLEEHAVVSVEMRRGISGCPHEEGSDYPEGETCPECPFWRERNRDELLQTN